MQNIARLRRLSIGQPPEGLGAETDEFGEGIAHDGRIEETERRVAVTGHAVQAYLEGQALRVLDIGREAVDGIDRPGREWRRPVFRTDGRRELGRADKQ